MRAVKRALDPKDILNRGRFLLLSFATPTVDKPVFEFHRGREANVGAVLQVRPLRTVP